MSDNIRELDQVQAELDILHERSQTNKANISSHEAVCEVRHKIIMEKIERFKIKYRYWIFMWIEPLQKFKK